MFDTYLEKISHKWIILNDLNLKHNKSFQIDSVLIGGQSIYPIDVKNFEHDYYMENGQWYHPNYPNDGKDLLLQLQRSKSLFQQLLTNLGYSNFTFISRLVFVNPTFTLYEAPRDLPAILPTQMNGFIENLGKQAVHVDFSHRKLADKLISMHRTKSEYSIIPAYDFESLEKGIFCEKCRARMELERREFVKCSKCGFVEKRDDAVMRTIEEYILLFPDREINTQNINQWCKIVSKRTISRVLNKNFKHINHGKYSTYIKVFS